MGFYSWTCAKTNLPILAGEAWHDHPLSQVALLTAKGVVAEGRYSGYGDIVGDTGPLNLMDSGWGDKLDDGTAKLVIASKYDPARDDFSAFGRSRHEPGQGYFHDHSFIEAIAGTDGFAAYAGYAAAYGGELPVEIALRADAEQMKRFAGALRRLRTAFSEARFAELAPQGAPGPDPYQTKGLALVPSSAGMETFHLELRPEGELPVRLPIDVSCDASDAAVSETAGEAMRLCRAGRDREVIFVSDGEDVATIECWTSEAGERWHILADGGERRFFWNPYEALDALPPEFGGRAALVAAGAAKALYAEPGEASARTMIELPVPAPRAPSP